MANQTTPEDSAAVSMSTARIIADLEYMAEQDDRNGWAGRAQILHDAIDRLIVLDNARQPVPHPRELALHQDAKRGNFRYQQEEDGA